MPRSGSPARSGPVRQDKAALDRHPAQRLREVLLHLFARDDGIEKAMLKQELRPLKARWQLLANCLFDNARPSKADKRVRLRNIEIAKHGEARGHSPGSRVSHHRNV